jgi:transcriptional regulator with XRE-family HTH domain
MELHEKIKTLRKIKRLTQRQMAEKLNIGDNSYSKMEQGITKISVARLTEIAKALNMEKQDIENFEEKMIFNNIENGTNSNFGNNLNIVENFEKERKQYEARITDLQNEIVFLRDMLAKGITK